MMRGRGDTATSAGDIAASVALCTLLAGDVLFGGAIRRSDIATAALEIIACGVLIWCVLDPRLRPMRASAWWLMFILAVGCMVCVLQLVPLSFEVWSKLPGREAVAAAFGRVGLGAVEQPVSLAPDQTLAGLFKILPALAMFVLTAKLPWRVLSMHLPWVVVILACLSVAFGLAQMLLPSEAILFPFGMRNTNQAAGFFEVVNHQAALQLMAIPFLGVLLGRLTTRFSLGDTPVAMGVIIVAAYLMLVMGVILSGSVAGYAMLAPVTLVSALLVFDRRPGLAVFGGGLVLLLAFGAMIYLALTSPILGQLGITDLGEGPLGRRAIYAHTLDLIGSVFPFGSGLGSFEAAYPAFEDPATVTEQFITHAHNDYLEVAAELGVAGCVTLGAMLAWCLATTAGAWRIGNEEGGRLKKAASVVVGVVIVHSLVDSPVRTLAISSLVAVGMAILASGPSDRWRGAGPSNEPLPAFRHKHVEI